MSSVTIEIFLDITKITNDSPLDLLISLKPIKPKRKYFSILLVAKGTFAIYESPLDLSKISISFIKGENNGT